MVSPPLQSRREPQSRRHLIRSARVLQVLRCKLTIVVLLFLLVDIFIRTFGDLPTFDGRSRGLEYIFIVGSFTIRFDIVDLLVLGLQNR